jgi:uncharacterized protein (DUF302 family)
MPSRAHLLSETEAAGTGTLPRTSALCVMGTATIGSQAMEHDRYVLKTRTSHDPATAEARVRDALSAEGFGILTEIDVTSTLKAKLDVEVAPYRILGACKPSYAHEAIGIDPMIGGLLPCNVVVRAHPEGGSELIAIDPAAMMGLTGDAALEGLAEQVGVELSRALATAATTD